MRDSGVEFLGEVPSHWDVQPAVTLARVLTSTVDKKSHEGEQPVRLCNYTDVYYSDKIEDNSDFMVATATPEQVAKFSVRAGDVPFTKDSETADDIGIPSYVPKDLPGTVYGYHLSIFRPIDKRRGRFLKYLLESDYAKAYFEAKTPGVTRVGLAQATIRYFRVPTPPFAEAVAIADYLDRETVQIDAFIAKNEELITLLTERRASAISEMVLRGLNPAVDFRESGVEGIGSLPAHWGTQPMVTLARVLTSTVDKKAHPDESPVKLCNYTDVYYSEVIDSSDGLMGATATPEQIKRFGVQEGDVPFTKDSESSEDIGISSYVERNLPGVVYGYHLGIYRPTDPGRGKYIKYLLDTAYVKDYFIRRTPGVTRVGLSQNVIRYLRAPVPPVGESIAIAAKIDRVVAEIDSGIGLARRAIRLASDRRSALISAAVTGKIDVREAA